MNMKFFYKNVGRIEKNLQMAYSTVSLLWPHNKSISVG